MSTREVRYLGHSIKELARPIHGRTGWRIARTGQEHATLRDAKNAIAAQAFPYRMIGGPPIGRRQT